MSRACLVGAALLLAACSSGARSGARDDVQSAEDSQSDLDAPTDTTDSEDTLATDSAPDVRPAGLPFAYTRPEVGEPVSPAELTAITDVYLELLANTRYFAFLDERVVGWPESDPQQRYWYGHWWTGAGFEKSQGQVSLVHVDVGADNAGIPTSFVLESVCLAHRMWPTPELEHLVRRMVRGFNAWILAMQRMPDDPAGVLLARVSYPESITSTDGGHTLFIDYSADRPGVDSYTYYVHIPANPHWGDIYIKNKRSKDDIGHMLRAIGTLRDCEDGFDAETRADIDEMTANYAAWSRRVEDDGWAIATLDQSLAVTLPASNSTMSRFFSELNAECAAMLAIRLFGRGDPGTFDCDNGINPFESLALGNPSNGEILRSFHEAAARNALMAEQDAIAYDLLTGLTVRIDEGMDIAESGEWPVHLNAELLVKLLVNSANVGVPLTAREVRWLHARIQEAYVSYVLATDPAVYALYDEATPDGAYEFSPDGAGIDLRFLAALVGTCTARYRNPTSQPLLDCSRLQSWTP